VLVQSEATVALFEGFVSFKTKKTEHVDDARRLLYEFVSKETRGYTVRATAAARWLRRSTCSGRSGRVLRSSSSPPSSFPDSILNKSDG
jgi:hypothetical protein